MSIFKRVAGFFWKSDVVDSASAIAHEYDTTNALSTAGAKLAAWSNFGTEKFAIDKDGVVALQTSAPLLASHGAANFLSVYNTGQYTINIGFGSSATTSKAIALGYGASAANGGVALGFNVTCTGSNSFAAGYNANVTGTSSTGLNREVVSTHFRDFAVSGEKFSDNGDNQFHVWQPAATTIDATPSILYMDEDTASQRMSVASGKMYAFEAHVVGVQSDGTDAAYFTRKGIIVNNGGTTALIGTIQTIGTDIESNASTDVTITADDTNDALQIQVTGIAAETWRWSANVLIKDITIGT